MDAKLNDKVLIEISDWSKSEKEPAGNILKVFGKAGEHEPEMLSIIYDRGIEADFSKDVLRESEEILRSSASDLRSSASRRDFRGVVTFTIDPKTAKDYDDALSFRQLDNDKFEIGVHIADVSFYVRPGTAIDDEAQKRATSVYLVDRTIPMLPEVLSNDLCSLVEGQDRLAYSAVFTLNKKAEILEEWFGRTIINSNKRFSYEDVEKIINDGEGQYFTELNTINNLAKELDKQKIRDGALAFEEDEVSFEIDADGKPISVFKKERLASHKLVEDFMLLANKRVAEFVSRFVRRKDLMFVYRIHEGPNPDKVADLIKFLKLFGYQLKIKGKKIVPSELNNFLKTIAGKPEESILNRAIIRSMSRAVYTTKNIGHFGLAFEDYTHFTSPIRRYPDVMVHRLLTFYLAKKYPPLETLQAYDRLCTHSSDREKLATEAERESVKYKQAEYLEKHIGEVFDGVVSGTTKWGMYVEELSTGAEGLVRLSDLKDDHYTFDEKKFRLIGEKTKKTFRLGDTLKIKVLKTNRVAKTIDFGIV
ncbi:MAG: ribonuclease R [Candidatus Vogelbacteria bacterium]|nr:ribonuclease R [Candidatus Vogelbacteria bacterium]